MAQVGILIATNHLTSLSHFFSCKMSASILQDSEEQRKALGTREVSDNQG